ncbi:MAG: Peptidase T [Parcubacteria group bacterium GW2011_GWA2_40_23]|nr:MAG: Peptidase T [Parcubacteria group bacterium GW2011_GWA2_40_23]
MLLTKPSLTGQRFLRYVRVSSMLDSAKLAAGFHPSSPGQVELAKLLLTDFAEFADEVGTDYKVEWTPGGVLIIRITATPGFEQAPRLGFSAHLDSYPNGSPMVEPLMHLYKGGDLALPRCGTFVPTKVLEGREGQLIFTSSGDSVLAADCKAGMTAIMEAMATILGDNVSHGPITLIFFPDEEEGVLNVSDFSPELVGSLDVLYTADAGIPEEVDTDCYSGRSATVTITGTEAKNYEGQQVVVTVIGNDAHPGPGGERIVPAHLIAAELALYLDDECPSNRGTHYGYVLVQKIEGGAGKATMTLVANQSSEDRAPDILDLIRTQAIRMQDMHPGCKTEIDVYGSVKSENDAEDVTGIVPAAFIASEFMLALTANSGTPWKKGKDDSYQYPRLIQNVDGKTVVICIPRAYEDDRSLELVEELRACAQNISDTYDGCTLDVKVEHTYTSIAKAIAANRWCVELLHQAAAKCGFELKEKRVPGGTDVAMLDRIYDWMPGPNIGAGCMEAHALFECCSDRDLDLATRWYVQIIMLATQAQFQRP